VEHLETVRMERGKAIRLFVELLKAASLEGTVYLEDGRRVSQAWCASSRPCSRRPGAPPRPSWLVRRTDKDGRYRFPVVRRRLRHVDLAARGAGPRLVETERQRRVDGLRRHALAPSVEEVQDIVPVSSTGADLRGIDPVLRQ